MKQRENSSIDTTFALNFYFTRELLSDWMLQNFDANRASEVGKAWKGSFRCVVFHFTWKKKFQNSWNPLGQAKLTSFAAEHFLVTVSSVHDEVLVALWWFVDVCGTRTTRFGEKVAGWKESILHFSRTVMRARRGSVATTRIHFWLEIWENWRSEKISWLLLSSLSSLCSRKLFLSFLCCEKSNWTTLS